ncbi:hypothetical protein [Prosthecobacter sp.]|uniref:hypothetical protein n=1 Tax=Prosthecobacter sp. TaxID=1965333 RepID=UPI003782D3EE
MRKKRALLTSALIVLLLLSIPALWLGIRWQHYRFLTDSGVVHAWSHADEAWFWRCPQQVYLQDLDETQVTPAAVGAALQHYASVQEINFRRNSRAWLDACLSRWQDRHSVQNLLVVYSSMHDAHLAGFAGADLHLGWFKDNSLSGETFPSSPHLTSMEIISNPLTASGLRKIAQQCPQLQKLWLHDTPVTADAVRDSGLFQLPALTHLYIREMDATEDELKALRKSAVAANPKLRLYLDDEL